MADGWLCVTVLGEGGPVDTSPVSKGKSCSLAEPQPRHLSLVKIKPARGLTLLDTQEMLSLSFPLLLPQGGSDSIQSWVILQTWTAMLRSILRLSLGFMGKSTAID